MTNYFSRNVQPVATAWLPKTSVTGASAQRLLVVRPLTLSGGELAASGPPFILLERQGELLLFEIKNARLFEFGTADNTIRIRQSFLTAGWSIEERGETTLLRKQKRIPIEEWNAVPIQASHSISDSALLKMLKMILRDSEFETIAQTRGHSEAAASEARIDAEKDLTRAKTAERILLPLGSVLLLLGVGHFFLPVIGFQFRVLQTAPPSAAIACGTIGAVILLFGLVVFMRSARLK